MPHKSQAKPPTVEELLTAMRGASEPPPGDRAANGHVSHPPEPNGTAAPSPAADPDGTAAPSPAADPDGNIVLFPAPGTGSFAIQGFAPTVRGTTDDLRATAARLAGLDAVDYPLQHDTETGILGFTAKRLDALVRDTKRAQKTAKIEAETQAKAAQAEAKDAEKRAKAQADAQAKKDLPKRQAAAVARLLQLDVAACLAQVPIEATRLGISADALNKIVRAQRRAASRRAAAKAAAASGLPEIVVQPGLRHKAADAGIAALHAAKVPFYQRGGGLVRVCSISAKSSDGQVIAVPGIVRVAQAMLGRALSTSANWSRVNERGELVPVDCPWDVVEEIGAMAGHWPFPPLAGVIGTQTMRPDGTLLCEPGYDAATGLFLHEPPPMPEIPDRPTWRDAEAALSLLNDLLSEFPFATNADRSVALSMLMTPVLRAALGPAVPMHVVTAPSPGTGKSYLADVASAISLGERCPVTAVAPKEEETEKRLVGDALDGTPIISLDNCNGVLAGGDFLAQVTERPVLRVHALGSSDRFRINNTFTVFGNGNNIVIYADMARRVVRSRLDANSDSPLNRTFTGDPVATVLDDRGRYVAAVLTIARAYIAAGMPKKPHRVPSYELWSDMVCGSLMWLKWPNPADTMTLVAADDPAGAELAAVLTAWPECYLNGASTAELVEAATACNYDDRGTITGPQHPGWLDAIGTVAKNKIGHLDALTLGKWLGKNRDRMVGNRKLLRDGTATRPVWKIETVVSSG